MKIAIIGYGRMGKLVETIASRRGHEIVCRIDKDNTEDFNTEAFRTADVAIEFSTPDSAVDGILHSFAAGIPVVCGTTGWAESLPEIKELVERGNGTILASSNFSIGVNIFMAVNRYLAKIMQAYPQYTPSMQEVHHIHKRDHPSGTAITLAEEIIACNQSYSSWVETQPGIEPTEKVIPVECERRGEVPGIHTITWDSDVDTIQISHSAKSREGFALGAVMAAEWLKGKKGFFTMQDMLKF